MAATVAAAAGGVNQTMAVISVGTYDAIKLARICVNGFQFDTCGSHYAGDGHLTRRAHDRLHVSSLHFG